MLETTCTFFCKSGITDRVALGHLRAIPRAKGLRPNKKCGAAAGSNGAAAAPPAAAPGAAAARARC